jgi:integrase
MDVFKLKKDKDVFAGHIESIVQDVISGEKSKVLRNEITEGTSRVNAVRLNTHIYEFFKFRQLALMDSTDIEEFVDYLTAHNLSTPTIIGYLSNLKKVIRQLMKKKILAQMPLFPKLKMNSVPRGAFTITEYARILRASKSLRQKECKGEKTDKRFHMRLNYRFMPHEMNWLIRFMVYTFMRPGDIRQLKNKHIEVISGKYNYLRITPPEIKRHRSAMVSMPQAVGIYARLMAWNRGRGFGRPEDYVFFPQESNRQFALSTISWLFSWILKELNLKKGPHGGNRTFYSLRHTAITFRLIYGGNIDLLTLARNARTSVEMIEKFYASTLSAEMNISLLHSKRQ